VKLNENNSLAVRRILSLTSWVITTTVLLNHEGSNVEISNPSRKTRPCWGAYIRVRRRARELFPQPLGPVTPRFSRGSSLEGRRKEGKDGESKERGR